jgi:hypothetical protein
MHTQCRVKYWLSTDERKKLQLEEVSVVEFCFSNFVPSEIVLSFRQASRSTTRLSRWLWDRIPNAEPDIGSDSSWIAMDWWLVAAVVSESGRPRWSFIALGGENAIALCEIAPVVVADIPCTVKPSRRLRALRLANNEIAYLPNSIILKDSLFQNVFTIYRE